MRCESANVVTTRLALTGVDPNPDLDAERSHRVGHCSRTFDGSCRTVEYSEETVAGLFDLSSAIALELKTHRGVVTVE